MITVLLKEQYLKDMFDAKIINKENKYSYEVVELAYIKEVNQYKMDLKIGKTENIKMENIPVVVQFELGKTTVLEKIKSKMKGWFL